MPPTPPRPPAPGPAPRPRALVHRGVVEASAMVLDETLVGPLAARRRAVAAWAPGASIQRLDDGALLVRFAAPRWIDCARAPGLPLVRTGRAGGDPRAPGPAGPLAALASAPLGADEVAALAPPDGAVLIVRGGVTVCTLPAGAEDPAGYLDVSGFTPIAVTSLGPAPPRPSVVLAPSDVPARRLFGIADEPPQRARVIEALRAARTGAAPAATPDDGRASLFAGLFAALSSFFARFLAARRPAPAGSVASDRGLVVSPGPERRPAGPSFFERFGAAVRHLFASALVRANLAPFLGRRQAEYLGKMIDLFEQGELSEALRHAIPLGGAEGDPGGGASPPMLGVPSPRQRLAISGGERAGTAPALFAPEDFYAGLRRRYRAAFEQLERQGRIEEAAFVLAELLRESAEAVAFLERHGRFRLAAEIAEARGLPPGLLVRQWLLAGDAARAVLLARRHGAFADAMTRLDQHPQAAVLRMLWAGSLADAGDFAAAVDVAWPLPEARPTAEIWIDAAIAQGGVAAARLLARKLVLVPASFPDVRARVLVLLDEATGSPSERRALAEGLLAEGPSPGASTLARALIRALVRDGGRAGEPASRLLVERLDPFAGDDALRADRPAWPTVERTPLAQLPEPRVVTVGASDSGATPVHDAAYLPDGRTILALGEAGVRILGPRGQPLFDLDQPAHRLVVSDRGDRALALARRGDAWRVARLDLVGRRAEVWCEARFDCTAASFDGSQWVVADGPRLLVIDALERRFEALASLDLGESVSRVHALARSPTVCVAAVEEPGALLFRRCYELPSWTLRQRGSIDTPRRPWGEGRAVFAASITGAVALLADGRGEPGSLLVLCSSDGAPPLEALLAVPSSARPLAMQVAPSWTACAAVSRGGVDVRLLHVGAMATRAQIMLAGATSISMRLTAETLTLADDRGRLLVIELEHGGLLREARV